MASASQKPKIDSLNAFIHQRLNNIAGEICQVFQETLAAYQEEINQSKQENVYLRNMLAEITLHRTDRIDARTSQADGIPPDKQNSSQAPMDPETSVIQVKLELSTTQQDLELPKQSCPTLACTPAPSDRDKDTPRRHDISDQRSHADGVPVPPKPLTISTESQKCSRLQIQVKPEPFTGHESEEQLNNASSLRSSPARTVGRQGSPHSYSVKPANVQAKKAHSSSTGTTVAVTIKPQTWNRTGSSSDILCTPGNSETQFEPAVKDERVPQPASQLEKPPSDVSRPRSRTQGHVPYRPFDCDVCRKAFQNEWQLKRHLLKHQNKRPNRCELCGKCYSTPHVLKIHFRTHTGERPYHCKFCEKTFSQIGHLKGHERIHTGEKIYSCSACGKCFTWLSQAKEHIRSHPGQMARVQRKINQ